MYGHRQGGNYNLRVVVEVFQYFVFRSVSHTVRFCQTLSYGRRTVNSSIARHATCYRGVKLFQFGQKYVFIVLQHCMDVPLQGPKAAELMVQICSRIIKLGMFGVDFVSDFRSGLCWVSKQVLTNLYQSKLMMQW